MNVTHHDATPSPIEATKKSRARRPRRVLATEPRFLSIAAAATLLDTTATALRARCRRGAEQAGKKAERVHLGGGVFCFRMGNTWRVSVPGT